MGRGRVTFLCVCPGLPVQLRHIVSCVSPLLRVCTYACACESAGKEDSFISSCLDYSHLKDVCVGKQRAATAHTHTQAQAHTPTLPPALSLIYKPTHTHGNVSVDHKELRQDGQKGVLCIWGTQFWQGLLNESHKNYHLSQSSFYNCFRLHNPSKASELSCKVSCLSQTRGKVHFHKEKEALLIYTQEHLFNNKHWWKKCSDPGVFKSITIHCSFHYD